MLICEMAAYQKAQGKTLLQRLEELYQQHGYYKEALDSFTLPGADGQQRIAEIMADLADRLLGKSKIIRTALMICRRLMC